jgi:hypothetical protein
MGIMGTLLPEAWQPVLPAAGIAIGLWGGTAAAWLYYRWKDRSSRR